MRWVRFIALAVALFAVFGLVRTTWYAFRPLSEQTQAQHLLGQVRWLNRVIVDADAAGQMQTLFPEGEAFTLALTAIATGRAGSAADPAESPELTADIASLVEKLASPQVRAGFTTSGALPDGIYLTGWRLHARLALARATGRAADIEAAVAEAGQIASAIESAEQPFLEAYPGRVWPVDTVVAVAHSCCDGLKGPLPARGPRPWALPERAVAIKCLYLVTRSLDPTGGGRARWMMRWKPALNAFAITFAGRFDRTTHS